jgi:hypothetical protein
MFSSTFSTTLLLGFVFIMTFLFLIVLLENKRLSNKCAETSLELRKISIRYINIFEKLNVQRIENSEYIETINEVKSQNAELEDQKVVRSQELQLTIHNLNAAVITLLLEKDKHEISKDELCDKVMKLDICKRGFMSLEYKLKYNTEEAAKAAEAAKYASEHAEREILALLETEEEAEREILTLREAAKAAHEEIRILLAEAVERNRLIAGN